MKCFPHTSLQFSPLFVCTLPLCSSNGQNKIAVVSCYLKEAQQPVGCSQLRSGALQFGVSPDALLTFETRGVIKVPVNSLEDPGRILV